MTVAIILRLRAFFARYSSCFFMRRSSCVIEIAHSYQLGVAVGVEPKVDGLFGHGAGFPGALDSLGPVGLLGRLMSSNEEAAATSSGWKLRRCLVAHTYTEQSRAREASVRPRQQRNG